MRAFKSPLLSLIILVVVGLIFDFGFNAYIQLMALFVTVNCLMSMSLNLVNGYTGQFSLGHAGFMALGAYFSAYLTLSYGYALGTSTWATTTSFVIALLM